MILSVTNLTIQQLKRKEAKWPHTNTSTGVPTCNPMRKARCMPTFISSLATTRHPSPISGKWLMNFARRSRRRPMTTSAEERFSNPPTSMDTPSSPGAHISRRVNTLAGTKITTVTQGIIGNQPTTEAENPLLR